jgi:hypothetical protein
VTPMAMESLMEQTPMMMVMVYPMLLTRFR